MVNTSDQDDKGNSLQDFVDLLPILIDDGLAQRYYFIIGRRPLHRMTTRMPS